MFPLLFLFLIEEALLGKHVFTGRDVIITASVLVLDFISLGHDFFTCYFDYHHSLTTLLFSCFVLSHLLLLCLVSPPFLPKKSLILGKIMLKNSRFGWFDI